MSINHVGPTLAQRDTWKRMVGIALAYAGFVGLRALDQHRTNGWQFKLARWAKWHRANVICRRGAIKTADKMPALDQQMIAIWVLSTLLIFLVCRVFHYDKTKTQTFWNISIFLISSYKFNIQVLGIILTL